VPSPKLEIADVFRRYGPAWRQANKGQVILFQLKVMSIARQGIAQQSAERGRLRPAEPRRLVGTWQHAQGAAIHCVATHACMCESGHIAYNSCKNRHCPKCQGPAARNWMQARADDLLPVEYFHVVFTLPAEIAQIAYWNKKAVYGLLFKASAQTVTTIAADPKRLGARVGMTVVLHTSRQRRVSDTTGSALTHHPHVHMIVPGGGLSPDGTRWIACKRGFFLHVRVLSRLFRRLFLDGLLALHRAGDLSFFSELTGLADHGAVARHLAPLRKTEWVVPSRCLQTNNCQAAYAKPPFGGPEAVLAYLSRYTHPTARQWFVYKP
jgi:hypothetical protein